MWRSDQQHQRRNTAEGSDEEKQKQRSRRREGIRKDQSGRRRGAQAEGSTAGGPDVEEQKQRGHTAG
eukprot:1647264-Heterocapsa_arctica.AAC.1